MSTGQPAALAFEVEIRGRENDGRRFPLTDDGLLVGRSASCDVTFSSREVSRRHAYFYPDAQGCYVEDLGSKNGVLVNGKRVKKAPLHDGDIVGIGPARFIVHARDERTALARWLLPGTQRERTGEGAEEEAQVLVGQMHEPLALSALVFGVFAYLHWVFGVCGLLLVLLSWRETRRESFLLRGPLLAGAALVALAGAALNAWFQEAVPRMHYGRVVDARRECKENLLRVRSALEQYRAAHGGQSPSRLEELHAEGLIGEEALRCPGGKLNPGGQARYLYFPAGAGGLNNGYAPVVCDAALSNHQGYGGWVLHGNGRLEWLKGERLQHVLRIQQGLDAGGEGP